MAKKLQVNTRVRFASPIFSEVEGIYKNEFKKGIILKIYINDYEILCDTDQQIYIVPKKGCTKDYYYYTNKEQKAL